MAKEEIIGIHDLIVHDYGPGRLMITLHAEVNSEENILYIHDVIDNIEDFVLSQRSGMYAATFAVIQFKSDVFV
mgnify:CR=1 FL=1